MYPNPEQGMLSGSKERKMREVQNFLPKFTRIKILSDTAPDTKEHLYVMEKLETVPTAEKPGRALDGLPTEKTLGLDCPLSEIIEHGRSLTISPVAEDTV